MKIGIKRTAALALLLLALCVFFVNLHFDRNVYLTEYTFTSEKLPRDFDGYKMALISDIHNSKYADKFIEALDKAKADAVVFSGDMIQLPSRDLTAVLKIAAAEKDKSILYAVFGNHEAENGYIPRKAMTKELCQAGIHLLQNDFSDIERGGSKIRLIGIEDTGHEIVDNETIGAMRAAAEKYADESLLNIMLYHRANLYPKLKDCPVDLILSGHLHGGIVRLPFVGGVVGESAKSLFPKYCGGAYKEGNASAEMIVSRGGDYNLKKMRVFNPPEIPVITLKCE